VSLTVTEVVKQANSYTQTNLVSDIAGNAAQTDPNLVNPWGLGRGSGTLWWVSDQVTGRATLYDGTGNINPLVVTVPPASGAGTGSPTGVVAFVNGFVFVTLDGTISQWTTGTSATIRINHSSTGAVYTGCTLANYNGKPTLYVANAAGGIEAYDTLFKPVALMPGAFADPNVPSGFKPHGIQNTGGKIYVTFTSAPGAGQGYVDAFDANGQPLLSLQHGNWMNQPWGIALAPANFGALSHLLLVGNTGSGLIVVFHPTTGKFLGFLKDAANKLIQNAGLWAIYFGGGNSSSGPATTLYFTAGIDGQAHGLFGSITAN
jgi:uncharacterized protein (TIGR03118 family)